MSNVSGAISTLADLLAGRAKPIIELNRLAPSSFYDVQYRTFVVAAAFEMHARKWDGDQRITVAKLKLLQFIATRPWLLATVRQWSQSRHDAQLSLMSSQRLRRGFLADTMHDELVAFLVAREIFVRDGAHLLSGETAGVLRDLYTYGVRENWFKAEREALEALKGIKVTNDMLEGA